jgi:hypothetical protein
MNAYNFPKKGRNPSVVMELKKGKNQPKCKIGLWI